MINKFLLYHPASLLIMNALADYFHHRRSDWPKERIPDFTIHASNRLTPLAGEPFGGGRRANGTLDKIDRGHRDDKRRSRSLNSSLEARSKGASFSAKYCM